MYFASTNDSAGGSAQSYIPEITWNDGNLAASGGGASTLTAKPSWQAGTGVPGDGQRDVLDLAFAASIKQNGLIVCNNGSCSSGFSNGSSTPTVTGGTSAGPATFGGVVALLVQETGSRVGLLNPNLYSLASISANSFHDITSGNNQVNCQGGSTGCAAATGGLGLVGYSAGVGYDQTTGLGSVDSYNLVEQWSGDIKLTASPTTVAVAPGTSATATITVTPVNNFTGPVSFSCSVASSLPNVTCSVPSTTVTTTGSTTVTITSAEPALSVPYKGLPKVPPAGMGWLPGLLGVFAVLIGWHVVRMPKFRAPYAWAIAGLLVLTLGAVGCGSGSSSGTLTVTCYLPEAQVDVAYNGGNCAASGGKSPYTYAIETVATGGTGLLPSGLSLNASTGAITGVPTLAGVSPFTISITDAANANFTQGEDITVGPAPLDMGLVTITAKSGAILNTTTILVTTSL